MMEGKHLARIGAVIFVAIAITATAIEVSRQDDLATPSVTPALQPPADPLRITLRRCQQLGEAAANDANCLAAWTQSRDRFLGREAR